MKVKFVQDPYKVFFGYLLCTMYKTLAIFFLNFGQNMVTENLLYNSWF